MRSFRTVGKRGVTLVEIMIALAVVSLVSTYFMTSIIFTIKQTRENKDQINGLQIMNYHVGLIKVANYDRCGKASLPAGIWEKVQFDHRDSAPKTVLADPNDPKSTEYNVSFEFTGWGTVKSATDSSVTFNIPSNQNSWTTDQWKDDYVSVRPVAGRAQMARVTGNTADTLFITTDLTGGAAEDWARVPSAGEEALINNGKTIDITVSWGNGQNQRTIGRRILKTVGR